MELGLAPPPLDGQLRFDEATRRAHADDFGHIVHELPEGVLMPRSADDLAKAIRWAARSGRKFAPQGRRHSTFGRSQVAGGIVAEMSAVSDIGPVEGERLTVGAGARWSDVLRATLAHGKTPPVLTEYLELSVGGTLVVGGVGAATSAHGLQSDNVIEIEVVTGEGKKVTCSASEDAELFDALRCGLGQVGVITRATLELVAAPDSVRRFLLAYPNLATMLNDARLLCADGRFDALQGAAVAAPDGGMAFRLDVAKSFTRKPPDDAVLLGGLSDDPAQRQPTTLEYVDYLTRFAPLEATLKANGQWFNPHPWLTTFIGDSEVESVVDAELGELDPVADLGPLGQIVLSPIRRSAISSPLLQMPSDDLCYAFNFIRLPATDDADEANRLVDANNASYKRVKAAGGTLYPVSAFPLSAGEWREHFGSAFGQLEAAKQAFDPANVLTPGYEIFPG